MTRIHPSPAKSGRAKLGEKKGDPDIDDDVAFGKPHNGGLGGKGVK